MTARESLERKIQKAATSQLQDQDLDESPAIVLAERGWHPGVIGIVAGRLAEKFHRPTVLIALDEIGNRPGMGSARTACGIDLFQALTACRAVPAVLRWAPRRGRVEDQRDPGG